MKKLLALILCFALLITAVIVPMSVSAETTLISTSEITDWDGRFNVADKGQYLRPKTLSDGKIGAAWYVMGDGGHFGVSTDGGVTYTDVSTVVKNAFETTAEQRLAGEYGRGKLEVQNPNFIELKDGRILYTYRYNTYTSEPDSTKESIDDIANLSDEEKIKASEKIKAWDTYYSSIRYQISEDGGANWTDPVIIKESIQPDSNRELGRNGYWEPEPYYIGEDLYVYWCDTVTNYNNLGVQNVLGAKWDGEEFGDSFIAIDGTKTSSRDGMCVVTTLQDGSYAMVYESTDTDGVANTHNIHDNKCYYCEDDKLTFVIKMARSTDGVNWNEEDAVIIAKPDVLTGYVDLEGGAENVCASPYVITLPDGRLAISYQTSDLYTGDVIPDAVVRRSVVQVAISDIAVGYDTAISTANFKKIAESLADIGDNQYANAGSLYYNNGRLLAYTYIGTNTLNEDSSVTSRSEGLKGAYINLESNELDSSSLENYIVYNNSGKTVTEENGVFTLPNGCTNMVYGEPDKVDVFKKGDAVEGLFDLANYTTYTNSSLADRMVIDTETNTISFDSQTRNWLAGTDNMTAFEASATIEGNSKGTIYAGFGFHMQSDAFNTGTASTFKYSTSGYTVIVKRSTTSANIEILVRYISGTTVYDETVNKITATGLLGTTTNEKVNLKVWADNVNFYVEATNASDATKTTGVYTYPLDYTSISGKHINWTSGGFMLTANGVNKITNFELYNATVETVDSSKMVSATDLDAKATINFPETLTTENQVGMSFRVQSAVDKPAPGVSGYVIKLLQTTDNNNAINVQMTRYGTKTDGTTNANLGNMFTYEDTTILGEGSELGASIIMDAKLRDNIITLTLTNANNTSLTSTYEFDLTKASGSYSDYYEYGGFGFFKNGNATDITVSDVSFKRVAKNLNKIATDSDYTIYCPENSEDVIFENNSLINNDAITKKFILNDTYVSDLNAEATFQIGEDGNFKGGIIFRAQNVGNETDDMEGYSVVAWKNPHTTGNNGRVVLMLYKWGRDAEGNLKYLGEIARLVDTTTINAVYPAAEKDILASAGAHIKINVDVTGKNVAASFDVYDENNIIAASSAVKTYDLTHVSDDIESKDVDKTLYNYGAVGASISSKGALCDFNVDADEYTKQILDAENFTEYTSNTYNFTTVTNDEIYSKLGGVKRLVDWTQNIEDFRITSRFKAFSETAQAFGFDFGLDSNEWNVVSGGSTVTTSTAETQYNSGYRITFSRVNKTSDLRIYFSTYSSDGNGGYISSNEYTTVTDFFAEYYAANSKYTGAEMDVEVKLDKDGNLTSKASLVGYTATAEYTVTGVSASGAYGIYMNNGGTLTGTKVTLSNAGDIITAADCENGFVYAATNSGAANVGDTVTIVPKAADGYEVDEVSYTVNGEKTVVEAVDGAYSFAKTLGATEIAATFKEAAKAGDIDGDGDIDGEDLILLTKILLKVETEYDVFVADFTGDGTVDVRDLVSIKIAIAANAEA